MPAGDVRAFLSQILDRRTGPSSARDGSEAYAEAYAGLRGFLQERASGSRHRHRGLRLRRVLLPLAGKERRGGTIGPAGSSGEIRDLTVPPRIRGFGLRAVTPALVPRWSGRRDSLPAPVKLDDDARSLAAHRGVWDRPSSPSGWPYPGAAAAPGPGDSLIPTVTGNVRLTGSDLPTTRVHRLARRERSRGGRSEFTACGEEGDNFASRRRIAVGRQGLRRGS